MKILIIALPYSIHTVRWLNQITNLGWEIHLYSSSESNTLHPQMNSIIYETICYSKKLKAQISYNGINVFFQPFERLFIKILKKIDTNYKANHLRRLIKRLQPDIVHSLETQNAGYLVYEVFRSFKQNSSKWIHTNWGSDIFLFGRLAKHKEKIRNVLLSCDYYSCECQRDLDLALKFGFRGYALPVFPNSGGYELEKLEPIRNKNIPSKRKYIMLKGYQHWCGRALFGLKALSFVKEFLKGFEIVIYSVWPKDDIEIASELFEQETNIKVNILPNDTPHNVIMEYHAKARMSIGLSISDSISTSMLEAMVMGSFPVQSNTAVCEEWFTHGETGFSVPPEEPCNIAKIIKQVLTDDVLVDSAAEKNWITAKKRLEFKELKQKAIDFYNTVYNNKENNGK